MSKTPSLKKKCKFINVESGECEERYISRDFLYSGNRKQFKFTLGEKCLSTYEPRTEGHTPLEAIAFEYSTYGHHGIFNPIDVLITEEVEDKLKNEEFMEVNKELLEKIGEEEFKQGLWEITSEMVFGDVEKALEGDKSDQEAMLRQMGVCEVEVTAIWNEPYEDWFTVEEIRSICPICGTPLGDVELKDRYCPYCGLGFAEEFETDKPEVKRKRKRVKIQKQLEETRKK